MNNFSDDDPQLTNFLRQYRSSPLSDRSVNSLPDPIGLEDRIMAEIDLLPIDKQRRVLNRWWRPILGGIGIIVTGILGMTIHAIVNPPAPSMAELDRLDRYLASHWHDLDADYLDADLLQDDDVEDM
jgi:hypothetical protein